MRDQPSPLETVVVPSVVFTVTPPQAAEPRVRVAGAAKAIAARSAVNSCLGRCSFMFGAVESE